MKQTVWTLILFFALLLSADCNAGPLPDTGQKICYDNQTAITCPQTGQPFHGQDAQYASNPRAYTKLDASGNPLPLSAAAWAMVRDEATGLVWESKNGTGDGGAQDYDNPHDADNTYTWYDDNASTNGGNAGTAGVNTDTQDFLAALNVVSFGGFDDWRLPTLKELGALLDADFSSTMLDPDYFPGMMSDFYWSSTLWQAGSDQAWVLTCLDGEPGGSFKSYPNYAVAVRGAPASNSFVDNGDGTVSDTSSGLMWQQAGVPDKNWQQALAYCEGLILAGHADWRLPDRTELHSLVDYTRENPSIDELFFPEAMSSLYWTSTTKLPNPAEAFAVAFEYGSFYGVSKNLLQHVRAVRAISSTTTTTVSTTTTTAKRCVFVKQHESQAAVQPLRSLRDSQLDTAFGAAIAGMYYRNMQEIGDILQQNPGLRARFNRLTSANMPAVAELLRQGTSTIAENDLLAIHDFLTDLQGSAGVKLGMDIDFVLRGLESGWLLEWLGLAVGK